MHLKAVPASRDGMERIVAFVHIAHMLAVVMVHAEARHWKLSDVNVMHGIAAWLVRRRLDRRVHSLALVTAAVWRRRRLVYVSEGMPVPPALGWNNLLCVARANTANVSLET